jgi:hypothetical protein
MNPLIMRLVGAIALLVPFLALCFRGESESLGQDVIVAPEKDARKPKGESVDVNNCIDCHQNDEARLKNPQFKAVAREIVRLDEVNTWWERDLHRKAFFNLKPNETGGPDGGPNLAARMEKVLRQSPSRGEKYQVARAAECLACHAVDAHWKPGAAAEPIKAGESDNVDEPRFDVRFGVSCEACHGVVDRAWGLDHAEVGWRVNTPDFKFKKGQIDLRDPAKRAERCTSCHVGSETEQKFVTHEMYAAGHPPLPAFEVATFTREQPAHFYPARENRYFKAELEKEKNGTAKKDVPSVEERFHYRAGESAEVRSLAYGAVAGFRSSVKLLDRDASKSGGGVLDFAHFDCASCHHDLKSPSDRQNRKEGITGRPLLNVQTELLDIVLDHACSAGQGDGAKNLADLRKAYEDGLKKLKLAATARPFGDPKAIQEAAKELDAATTKILEGLKPIVYDKKTALGLYDKLLQRLEALGKSGGAKSSAYIDFDAAEQLTWALLLIRRELNQWDVKMDGPAWEAAEMKLAQILPLVLREPYGKEPLESVEKRLKNRLRTQYKFEASDFFKAIGALPKPPADK